MLHRVVGERWLRKKDRTYSEKREALASRMLDLAMREAVDTMVGGKASGQWGGEARP